MCHDIDRLPRRIALLVFDGARTIDVAGLLEVFDVARTLGCAYSVTLCSATDGPLARCSSGLSFDAVPTSQLSPPADTILVVGGESLVTEPIPHSSAHLIRTLTARRIAGIGTGAFALGAAGLLDGRRATTHWQFLDNLAMRHPATAVERESVYIRDGDIWTSAGAASSIDLAMALVADDHGTAVAGEITKNLVVLSRRMEGHPQISAAARTPRPKHPELDRLMSTVSADPAGNYELDYVATELGLSPRHLARLFKAQVGKTLRQYVYEVRLENAVGLVLGGESFHAAAQRSGLRYGARVRDYLAAHRDWSGELRRADDLLVDSRGAEPVPVYTG